MARGSAVREFVGKLRESINNQIKAGGFGHGGEVRRDIMDIFHRAIVDALLGNGSEQKPVAKPRKKRGPNKPKPPAGEQAQP